jgi:nucleotide-binding universal stress UspA family protein
MLIRAWQRRRPRSAVDLAKIVVPLDGSEFAEAALPAAAELAAKLGAELVLTQAVRPPDEVRTTENGRPIAYIDQDLGDLEAEARRYLTVVEKELLAQQPELRISLDVRAAAPVEGIVSASDDRAQAPVVMSTHGRSGLSRIFLGSVAGAVLREGNMPLLLVRPSALTPAPSGLTFEEEAGGPPITLELEPGEAALVRTSLELLEQSLTRHEHLTPRIQRLLGRLPARSSAARAAEKQPAAMA